MGVLDMPSDVLSEASSTIVSKGSDTPSLFSRSTPLPPPPPPFLRFLLSRNPRCPHSL